MSTPEYPEDALLNLVRAMARYQAAVDAANETARRPVAEMRRDVAEAKQFTTPKELALRTGWSERAIRAKARETGACRLLGNRMIMTDDDVAVLLEACRPKRSTDNPRRMATGSYAELVRMRSRTKT